MSNSKAALPPEISQIEVSLLGPGYGESVLIHLGNNKWIIIDSCIDSKTLQPAPLEYLKSIGVDPETAVVLIIATHWHDDHVRGISKVLSACSNAKFCHSAALRDKQFLNYVFTFGERNPISAGSGTEEWIKVLDVLNDRPAIRAGMNRKVHYMSANESGHGEECSVWTLSPSDKQVELFLRSITKFIPKKEIKHRVTKYRATQPDDNHQCIVTWIEIGEHSILLGGDLIETADPDSGWSVIVKSKERPQRDAAIFKVPHHGSKNAHNDDVWSKMLSPQPYAIVTPHNRGKKKIPSPSDVARIEAYTSNGYATAKLSSSKSTVNRPAAVERTIKETVGKIRKIQPNTGLVRLRNSLSGPHDWSVELFGSACKVADVHA